MAPPAKRRRRNLVESDAEDDEPVQQYQKQQKRQQKQHEEDEGQQQHYPDTPTKKSNSIKDFLVASPTSRDPAGSPTSPVRKTTRSTTTATAAAAVTTAPPSFLVGLRSRGPNSSASTKSPSASPEKRGKKRGGGSKVEEKGRSADLLTLFSKQAQRTKTRTTTTTAAAAAATVTTSSTAQLHDISSDPISEDDNVADHKAVTSSIVARNASKRFRAGGGSTSSTTFLEQQQKNQQQQQQQQLQQSQTAPPATSQMFRRPPRPTAQKEPPHDHGSNDKLLRPWSERFAPTSIDELAVHKRKVTDVRRWLEDVMDGRMRQRLLILKGAAGSGKTTTVRLLARELQCEVLEWRNPTGSSYGAGFGQGHYQSAASQFDEFIGRGGRFAQLELEDDDGTPPPPPPPRQTPGLPGQRRLMLVEEFPNTFMRSSSALTAFRGAILQFLATNTPSLATFGHGPPTEQPIIPIVMIISETLLTTTSASADSFTAHRLLGPEILGHPGTGVIEFNAIAPTILSRALELVVQKEARKSGRKRTPGPQVLKKLGEIGDIRNAISSLEFLCLKGDDDADWGARVSFTKAKRGGKDVSLTKGERESLEMVSQREASLGIFHAVGKVVYNKRDDVAYPPGTAGYEAERLPSYISHLARPKQSLVQVDSLMDETGTDTSTFISAIHENYALSCESTGPGDGNSAVDYLNGCLEWLSDSDLLCPSWDVFFGGRGAGGAGRDLGSHVVRQDEMAFELAVRGVLFSLPNPVKRRTSTGNRRGGGGGSSGGGDAHKMFFPTSIKLWRAKEELQGLTDMWAARMLRCEDGRPGGGGGAAAVKTARRNLGDGATAFRRPKPATGQGSQTASNEDAMQPPSSSSVRQSGDRKEEEEEEASPPPPLLSLGSSARNEMLLERLPYMAHMARRRRGSLAWMGLRDLEKVVAFQGIGGSSMADDDSAGEDDYRGNDPSGGAGEAWATDKPTDEGSSPKSKKRKQKRSSTAIRPKKRDDGEALPAVLQVQKLVLSDDDIED